MDSAAALVHVPFEEAFGLVVAEALARNLKLFGTNVGGIPEIAAESDGAELFSAEDWTGLANSIRCWMADGMPRPGYGADAMLDRYRPGLIARRHVKIYQEILGQVSSEN
jgi:glycosyltransferase involved in cell wall biosynthesis